MRDILDDIVGSLNEKENIVLATIISSSGSTPLPAGASMVIKDLGETTIGTVGGGLFEARVIEEAKVSFKENRSAVILGLDLNANSGEEGMVCGGSADVLLELIDDTELPLFSKVATLRDNDQKCVLLRLIDTTNRVTRKCVIGAGAEDLTSLSDAVDFPTEKILKEIEFARAQEIVKRIPIRDGEIILEPIKNIQPLIIFGGGHIGQALSKVASTAGFAVTVIDDREEFTEKEKFKEALQVLCLPFQEAFKKIKITRVTSIVTVTRGHRIDTEILEHAISTPARYIGMIGSRRKIIATFNELLQKGISLESLQRVYAPIGLDIGAVSAGEIAVSIVAELIRVRRGIHGPSTPLSDGIKQWFDNAEAGSSEKS